MAEGWDPNPSVQPPPVLPNASSEMMSVVRESFDSVSLMMPDGHLAMASHGGSMATTVLGSNIKPEEDSDHEGVTSLSGLAFVPSLQPAGFGRRVGLPEDSETEGDFSERKTPSCFMVRFLLLIPY